MYVNKKIYIIVGLFNHMKEKILGHRNVLIYINCKYNFYIHHVQTSPVFVKTVISHLKGKNLVIKSVNFYSF